MKARNELWLITFLAFGVNYMLRININIAIVDMVVSTKNPPNYTVGEFEKENMSEYRAAEFETPKSKLQFHWDEYEQNLILSAYFWTHWILQLPGGILAHRYGTKLTVGMNNLLCALLTLVIPLAASYGFKTLFIVRAAQGFIAGAFWPSMNPLVAKWIPPRERGTFVSAYAGSSVGAAFTYFLCGIIIESFGWQYTYYVTGVLGLLWWILWVTRVYESPQKHPWISKEEREYIEQSLGNTFNRKRLPIPWKRILTSRAILINGLTQWGANGIGFVLLTLTPMYLNYIHGLAIKNTGLWSGVPHLTKWIVAICFGLVTEHQTCLSVTNIRKLATALCTIGVALILYPLALLECNTFVAVGLLLLANTITGTHAAGLLANLIDISPNFAGVLQGLIGVIGSTPGFIYPLIIGYMTKGNQTSGQWQKFFLVGSTITLVSGLLYLCFGTSEVQPWNFPEGTEKETDTLRKEEYPMKVKHDENKANGEDRTKNRKVEIEAGK